MSSQLVGDGQAIRSSTLLGNRFRYRTGEPVSEVVVQRDACFIEHGSAYFTVEIGRYNVVFGKRKRLSFRATAAALTTL